jgi:hypothetical protein
METMDSISQIHELIEENIPDFSGAIKLIEEEFLQCPHPPSFIYRLSQNILRVKSLQMEKRYLNHSVYLIELLGSLANNSRGFAAQ